VREHPSVPLSPLTIKRACHPERRRREGSAVINQKGSAWIPTVLQDCPERAYEARQYIFSFQCVVLSERGPAAVGAVDARAAAFGIDDPDQACAGFQPVANFGEGFAGAVVG